MCTRTRYYVILNVYNRGQNVIARLYIYYIIYYKTLEKTV